MAATKEGGRTARKSRSGSYVPHSARKGVRLEVYISEEHGALLADLMKRYSTKREAIEAALEKLSKARK